MRLKLSKSKSKPDTEYFEFFMARFNVTEAKRLVEGREPNGFIGVKGSQGFASLVKIDFEYAKSDKVDLKWPILVATLTPDKLPIDGWHRINKAFHLGVDRLPCHVLTEAETASILGDCEWKKRYLARKEQERLARVDELDSILAGMK